MDLNVFGIWFVGLFGIWFVGLFGIWFVDVDLIDNWFVDVDLIDNWFVDLNVDDMERPPGRGKSWDFLGFFPLDFRAFLQISSLPCIDDSFSSILSLAGVASGPVHSFLLPHELQDHLPEHLGDGLVPGPARPLELGEERGLQHEDHLPGELLGVRVRCTCHRYNIVGLLHISQRNPDGPSISRRPDEPVSATVAHPARVSTPQCGSGSIPALRPKLGAESLPS